jgi:hypothetical protein
MNLKVEIHHNSEQINILISTYFLTFACDVCCTFDPPFYTTLSVSSLKERLSPTFGAEVEPFFFALTAAVLA